MQKQKLYQKNDATNLVNPIKLENLLSKSDLSYMAKNNIYFVSIINEGKTMVTSKDQFVAQNSVTINRDQQNNIIGLPIVMGG